LAELLREAVADESGPTALRFPKAVAGADIPTVDRVGEMDLLRRDESGDVLIVSVGALAPLCVDVAERVAAQGLGVTVVDPRWVLPVDNGLPALCSGHGLVVVVADGVVAGGIGSAVSHALRSRGISVPLCDIALPHHFLLHGRRSDVLAAAGLSAQEIARQIVEAAASADADVVSPR
jgi:1-deoxy-D-xylulose-5-phosphate synthase